MDALELSCDAATIGLYNLGFRLAPAKSRMLPTWPKTIVCGHAGAAVENGRKTGLPTTEIAKGFWPPLETGPNEASGRPLRPRFYPGSTDHPDADPCPAGICHSPRLDDRPAGQRNRVGGFSAGAARATAGSGTSPRDRRGVSLATGPLGQISN